MRRPAERGTPVETQRLQVWLARFHGYRVVATEARIRTWLGRFAPADADMAARVLDAVEFFTDEELERILRRVYGRLLRKGWSPGQKGEAKWRFAAFGASSGESGDTMLHKFRRANRLRGARFNEYFVHKSELLAENLRPEDTVVFFDDISGSGDQASKNWDRLKELLPAGPRVFLALIVISSKARKRIESATPIGLIFHAELRGRDDVFSDACTHFNRMEKAALLRYCKVANRKAPRGYGDCGFLVVFCHDCPNNSIPVLHANDARWRGLFPR